MPICVDCVSNSSDSRSKSNLRILNLLERRCLAPLNLSGGGNDGSAARRIPYLKLPPSRFFKLSVLKLDGSLFDVNVSRNATVGQLKTAVEALFSSSPAGKISWSHVWAHFCLSYEGQMLINDKALIRNLGIKDGDQLEFIRHMSVNNSPLRRQSRSQSVPCKRCLPKCKTLQGNEQTASENEANKNESQVIDSKCHVYEDEEEIPMSELKFPQILRGWLSYRRLWGALRKGSERRNDCSRHSRQNAREDNRSPATGTSDK